VDLITSLAKFSVLFLVLQTNLIFARETFEFNLGEKINILSDKAFRKSSQNEFEAVGNVVITHLKNSIYGEKATVNFTTGETEVVGNVRYIAPELTLYGTRLKYNLQTKKIDIFNARILSDNYVITGKKISQTEANIIYSEEAEYTTCKDCPESWSISGKQIVITVGQYIKITHAFIKINGVIAMYVPYIIFPIKKNRETGLLFPSIGFTSEEGFRYQQPFFWVIDDYRDLTLTPSTFGDRGLGGEFQYRHNFKEKTWLEVNSLQIDDEIYEPYKTSKEQSGKKEFRYFSDIEGHYVYKQFVNGHFYFNDASDLDTIRDMDFFAKERVRGTELGGGGFLEGRNSLFTLGVQSYYNKNLLFHDPLHPDKQYVQILPKISLSSVPYNFVHSEIPFMKGLSFGLQGDYTIFKQNQNLATGPIRNAQRLNFTPYLDWQIGSLGPVIFSNQTKLDYQDYRLPKEETQFFSKRGVVFETEMKFELEKIYGLAYNEEQPINLNKSVENKPKENPSSIVGELPQIDATQGQKTTTIVNNSYRHSQEFKFRHYYLSDQIIKGNTKFRDQIENEAGQFDYVDAIRTKEHLFNQTTATDSLPMSNTIELQWNNGLIRKTARKFDPYKDGRYLKDNFDYSNITYFEVSQGVDLTVDSDNFSDRLTRLYINSGVTLDRLGFAIQEFYFHRTNEHKLTSNASYTYNRASLSGRFTYNSFNSTSTPISKLVGYGVTVPMTDLFTFSNTLDYDIENKIVNSTTYSMLYAPYNNCWKIELSYARDQIDKSFGIMFYLNYNNNSFTTINVK
jgi:LPS-assembly protein